MRKKFAMEAFLRKRVPKGASVACCLSANSRRQPDQDVFPRKRHQLQRDKHPHMFP